jgi:hypothetical protein
MVERLPPSLRSWRKIRLTPIARGKPDGGGDASGDGSRIRPRAESDHSLLANQLLGQDKIPGDRHARMQAFAHRRCAHRRQPIRDLRYQTIRKSCCASCVNIQVAVEPVLGLAHMTSVAPLPLKSPEATIVSAT